jgi:hypothetical protein
MWRRACGYGVSTILAGSRGRAGSHSWRRPASSRGARDWSWIRLRRQPAQPRCGNGWTRARRPRPSCSSRITSGTSICSCAATASAPSAPAPLLSPRHPRDRAGMDRARQPASGRDRRPLRRTEPQRDAAVAARAACPRLRRRADGAGGRAASLGDPVARAAGVACTTRAARPPVRARDRLARRAGAQPRRLRARPRDRPLERIALSARRVARGPRGCLSVV